MLTQDKYILIALVVIATLILVGLYRSAKGGPVKKHDVNNQEYLLVPLIGIAILFWVLYLMGYSDTINTLVKMIK